MPKITKLSELFALLGWISVLVLAWLLAIHSIPSDGTTWFVFAFLCFFSTVSSAAAYTKTGG